MERVYEDIARSCGFECIGFAPAASLQVRPEVRAMCAADKCHAFDRSWSCPPACGTLEEYRAIIGGYDRCMVVQTVGQMEDEFDYETMMEASAEHKRRFLDFAARALDAAKDAGNPAQADGAPQAGKVPHLLAAGSCTVCSPCSYPDEPCRFPDKRFVSMEAAGLVVSEVCEAAGIPYNHGKDTIAYTSCILY